MVSMVSLVQINNTAPAGTTSRAHAVLAPRTLNACLDSPVNFARTSSPLTLNFLVRIPLPRTEAFRIVLVFIAHNRSRHGHFLVQRTRQIVPELAFAADDKHLGQRFDLRRCGCTCGSRSRSADRRRSAHCRSAWCGAGTEERSGLRSGVVVIRRAEGGFRCVIKAGSADGEGVAVVGARPCARWTRCWELRG